MKIVSLPPVCGNVVRVPTEIESLYREHRARLVRLVERELHDHQDAEDVVQTAFLDAQRALERGTIPRNPPAWLAAIALNSAHRLRRRRLNAEPLEEYAVQEASRMSEIRPALASLPREQRAAVLYRDVLGLSYGETAEQMGTSVNAVTMLLHRGRQRLRQTLAATVGGLRVVALVEARRHAPGGDGQGRRRIFSRSPGSRPRGSSPLARSLRSGRTGQQRPSRALDA